MVEKQIQMKLYSPISAANTLLELAAERGSKIDPMKLQKLLYFAHGWHLAFWEKPLIDEPVQAWQFGPVIKSVYHTFKDYGANPILEPAVTQISGISPFVSRIGKEDTLRFRLLHEILRVYGGFNSIQLSSMSHKEGSPWEKVWKKNTDGLKYIEIPNSDIQDYFKKMKQDGRID